MALNVTTNSPESPIYNGLVPLAKEGPKGIPYHLDWTQDRVQILDLGSAVSRALLSFVQSVYVDNSNSAQDITFQHSSLMPTVNMRVPAGAQALLPIFAPNPPKLVFSQPGGGAGVGYTDILLLNVPVTATVWGASGGEAQSTTDTNIALAMALATGGQHGVGVIEQNLAPLIDPVNGLKVHGGGGASGGGYPTIGDHAETYITGNVFTTTAAPVNGIRIMSMHASISPDAYIAGSDGRLILWLYSYPPNPPAQFWYGLHCYLPGAAPAGAIQPQRFGADSLNVQLPNASVGGGKQVGFGLANWGGALQVLTAGSIGVSITWADVSSV